MTKGKMTVEYLLGILVKHGLIDKERAVDIGGEAHTRKRTPARLKGKSGPATLGVDHTASAVDILVSLALPLPGGRPGQTIDEETIMKLVAREVNLAYRKIDPLELNLEVVTQTLPRSFAMKHLVVPVGIVGGTLEVAVCDPFDHMVLDDVRRVSELEVTPVISTKTEIRKLIREFYGFRSSIAGAEGQLSRPSVDFGNLEQYVRLKSTEDIQANDQHVKNAVDYLFNYAFEQRASDIHIEPKRNESLIRMRIDGLLHNIHRLPKVIHPAMVSRIKSISRLDIAEKRRPQDGRIKIARQGHEAEVRVSTIPVAFGEKVVLRILDPDILFRDLKNLFFDQENLDKYRKFIAQPHGIILVTGPTGSGKSTTLYSSLRSLAHEGINITTVEDPIEMIHEEFNQIAVQPLIGVDFGSILRNILRQDPDIIMIGEMRDYDTVENAIQAALTGHLVLSTLHTNDAPSAVTRLVDLGAERFLVSSTVIGVVAQRLLRRICPHCVEDFQLGSAEAAVLGLQVESGKNLGLKHGVGCEKCRGTGYMGRVAALEVMPFSENLRQLTMAGVEAKTLKKEARNEGMRTLRENAVMMMLRGVTTYQEVLRVTVED